MKRILLVDDDVVVLRMYQDALTQQGYQTDSVNDGISAIQAIRTAQPDLVVLDLMMPKFSGADVLKHLRGQAEFKDLPVILLSNSFMNDLAAKAVALGVQRALLKVRCSPPSLIKLINDVLAGRPGTVDPSELLAIPKAASPAPIQPATPAQAPVANSATGDTASTADKHHRAVARKELLANAPKIRSDLHSLARGLIQEGNEVESDMWLNNFYRRVHFLTMAAGMADAHDIALLSSAFEALLFELMGRPVLITPSVRRTLAFTTDFLGLLLERASRNQVKTPIAPKALVVDDDPLSNRLVTSALRRAQLEPRCTEDPLVAMQWVYDSRFDLVLLDIEMPGMNGLEFCRKLRSMPGYQRTPVIFVTSHGDFEHRAQSILSGGNDLIAKPVLPIELTVKTVTQLLKSDLDAHTSK